MAAEVARAVAGGVAALGEPLAEDGFGLDDDVGFAAVEEEVLVLRGEGEVRAGVEAEGSGGTEVVSVVAVPHEGVDDEDVGIGPVVYGPNRVASRRRSEIEIAGFRADQEVPVVRASAAVVNAERVVNWDLAARGPARACCLGCS
ncbi:hypothetical protein TIFTF001_005975 [Ficus carica]|uniref:Uncharacterized protein n=1 Tax=Ficus carica TaxID=3494 RepID=A0AA88CVG0_FICCA|nr:hypothetical protein TIFTF001_005975 [Ficus carica]